MRTNVAAMPRWSVRNGIRAADSTKPEIAPRHTIETAHTDAIVEELDELAVGNFGGVEQDLKGNTLGIEARPDGRQPSMISGGKELAQKFCRVSTLCDLDRLRFSTSGFCGNSQGCSWIGAADLLAQA